MTLEIHTSSIYGLERFFDFFTIRWYKIAQELVITAIIYNQYPNRPTMYAFIIRSSDI